MFEDVHELPIVYINQMVYLSEVRLLGAKRPRDLSVAQHVVDWQQLSYFPTAQPSRHQVYDVKTLELQSLM